MPSLRQETLRAWLFLHFGEEGSDGPDYPASELSYRSELVDPETMRFSFYRTHDGAEQLITYLNYPVAGRAHGTVERKFIEDVAVSVERSYEARKARFLKLQEIVQAAGYPV
jgi:hypothetical protein